MNPDKYTGRCVKQIMKIKKEQYHTSQKQTLFITILGHVAEATIVVFFVLIDDPFPILLIHLSIYGINIFKPLKSA